MRKIIGTIGAALAIVAFMATLAAGAMADSSGPHREPPRIMLDPSADNTDIYTYSAPDAPGRFMLATRAEVDVSGDKSVLVSTEPDGGSPMPTSNPVLAASMT